MCTYGALSDELGYHGHGMHCLGYWQEPPMREAAREPGGRLVSEGRLIVKTVGPEIEAACRGDSGAIHRFGYREGRWSCDCDARTRCAHLVALMLVGTVP